MPKLATIAAFGFADFNPPTLLPIYRSLGCRSSQFYRNTNNPPDPAEARRIASDAGVPIESIHGVFGLEHDPSSPDPAIRKKAIETYRREGDLALTLGGTGVVVHPAPMSPDFLQITPQSRSERVAALRKSLEELAAIGERSGAVYLLENIPPNYRFGSDSVQMAMLIRELNHPSVRMCFDTGHAWMQGDPTAALEACLDVIGYLHVHDNDSRTDSHMIPGHGTLPWEAQSRAMCKLPAAMPAMLELFQSEPALQAERDAGLPARLRQWLALA